MIVTAVLVAVVVLIAVATVHSKQQAGSRTTAECMGTGCTGKDTGRDTYTDWRKNWS